VNDDKHRIAFGSAGERHLHRQLERAAESPDEGSDLGGRRQSKQARIAELERELAELREEENAQGAGRVQVVKRSLTDADEDRIASLERRLEEVIGEARSVVPTGDRPAIQVIQRTEVETGKKKRKPTPTEEKANLIFAGGCAIAMILWAAWCTSLGAAALLLP